MKRNLWRLFLLAALLVICTGLTACGAASKEFDENTILKSLPESACTIRVSGEDRVLTPALVTIDSAEEVDGIRIIHATVQLEDDYYRLTRKLKMNFDYTQKNGWRLGYFTDLEAPVIAATTCPLDLADADAVLAEEALGDAASYRETSHEADGSYAFTYSVNQEQVNLTLSGSVAVRYALTRSPSGNYNWVSSIDESELTYDWHFLGQYKVNTVAGNYEVNIKSYDPETAAIEMTATRKSSGNRVYKNAVIEGYTNISPGEKPHGTRCIKVKVNWNGDPKIFYIYPDVILLEDNEVWDLDKIS